MLYNNRHPIYDNDAVQRKPKKKKETLSLKAQQFLERWCNHYRNFCGQDYYITKEDSHYLESFFLHNQNTDGLDKLIIYYLKNYLKLPVCIERARRIKAIFAPSISLFLQCINDIPFVAAGKTPNNYRIDDDGEVIAPL